MGLELGAVGHLGVLVGRSEAWGLEESLGGSTMDQGEDGENGESAPIAVQNFLALALQGDFEESRPGCMRAQFAAHFPKKGIWYTGPRSLTIMCNSLNSQRHCASGHLACSWLHEHS